ncbi:hypothetical protein [Methylobacterium sp. WL116]|uniref:hypothetical protein n=1 Tax=Methylobacterium sp. WL116 TaxID=2603889 RepID=UPI0011C95E0C|nr:hypothetical protein [Methylobacterium sp. WL116]TXM88777.1 hypothetical protein FV223_23590 [Methylobacterium sp. WL116]
MSLISNERIKLSAAYLNTAAGGLFTAGVVAALVATVFGVSGRSNLSALTLSGGIAIFFLASIALYGCARIIRGRLQPWPTFRSWPSSSRR